ncbi:MAG: hypothetical protein ACREFV_10920, partial [Acetobacteraceae bacterium]
ILTPANAGRDQLRAAIRTIAPGFERADFAALARGVRALAETTPTPISLAFFSDFKRSSLSSSFSDLQLPADVTLRLHPIASAPAPPNWTVASIQAPPQLWGSPRETPPARIEAVVAGYNTPAASRTATLELNGRAIASQTVAVPASGAAPVVFPSVVIPYGWSRIAVRISPADAFAADDAACASVYRSDPERILFVHSAGDQRSPFYFSAALGGAFRLDSVSAAAAADQRPSDYSLVVVSDVPALPDAFARALQSYVQSGGGALIAAGTAARDIPFFRLERSRNYGERSLAVASSDPSHPVTAPLGTWPGVRFFFADSVAPAEARVLARLSDQTPLLLDQSVGEGHVLLFASGLDNLTNDLPLHAAFVPFVRQAAHYLAGDADLAGGSRQVDSFLTLRTGKEKGISVQVTDPSGGSPLSLAQSTTASALPLDQQGFYHLQLANRRQQLVGVNPDRRESDLSVIPSEDLALWRGGPTASPASPAPGAASRQPLRLSLSWYIILVLLAVAAAESVVAARYLGVSRAEESVPGAGVAPFAPRETSARESREI